MPKLQAKVVIKIEISNGAHPGLTSIIEEVAKRVAGDLSIADGYGCCEENTQYIDDEYKRKLIREPKTVNLRVIIE